jgi:outer membrane protein, heavy metal efflux system
MKIFISTLVVFMTGVHSMHAESLNFSEALHRVYSKSYLLSMTELEAQIAQAEEEQAHLLPNPEIDVSVDDVFGRGKNRGFRGYQATVGVSQLIELGSIRTARQNLAAAERAMVQWDQVIARLDLRYRLLETFIEVATLQEGLKVSDAQTHIASEIFQVVKSKVELGKVSPIQQRKAEISYNTAVFLSDEARSDLEDSRHALALLWESHSPDFESVIYPFYDVIPPPPIEALMDGLDCIPDLARSISAINAADRNLILQRAQKLPPVVVSAGYTGSPQRENTGFNFGISVPIPVFDQNQANIRAADLQASQAIYRHQDRVIELKKEIIQAHKLWSKAYRQLQTIQTILLPQAQETFAMTEEGYRRGKFEFLELLDAQGTFFDVNKQYIEALSECHHKKAIVERLIAREF